MSNSPSLVIGIDPGAKGGIAIFDRDGTLLSVCPMPLDAVDEVDPLELYHLLDCNPVLVVVEKVGPNPVWSRSSIWKFARNFESIISVIKLSEHPFDDQVLPTTWKKAILAGTLKDKNAAIAHAHKRYPTFASVVKKHDGMADAICIGEYGVRVLLSNGETKS